MFNSLRSVSTILKEECFLENWLPVHQHYRAHNKPNGDPETLIEHYTLVNSYFERLCFEHNLDAVIDRLITRIISRSLSDSELEYVGNVLKRYFVFVICFHDFGKVNENFQADPTKMNNLLFRKTPNHLIGTKHSGLGAYLFILNAIQSNHDDDRLEPREKQVLDSLAIILSYSIFKHHAPFLNEPIPYEISFGDEVEVMKKYFKYYHFEVDEGLMELIPRNLSRTYLKGFHKTVRLEDFPLFSLMKLSFSLLTASDFLATFQYMNDSGSISDLGTLSRERIEALGERVRNNEHSKAAYTEADQFEFSFPQARSNENLNRLRKQMAIEVLQHIRLNTHEYLFYIEAPTGGGKTNLSIIATIELLLANGDLNKVFYVFPFTTLITQTYKVLKSTLGLSEEEIAEIHAKAGFHHKISNEETRDGEYGDDKKNFVDNLFALFPVSVLSHVRFFDILKSNRKEINYLLHRMANSVVVIDEIQSYNPKIWDKMLYLINEYGRYFNIRFILMSATLPRITGLNIGLKEAPNVVDLVPNAVHYMRNPNFSGRVGFNFEVFHEKMTLERLADIVREKSEAYAAAHGAVRTIVEFIYKKSAAEFQQYFQGAGVFDQVLLLSGTTLEHRRREIINTLKRNTGHSILLITTQVVEAGVDIDMDLGFKNVSLPDSDEQLAGRVNRNAFKSHSQVYLFQLDDPRILYGKDLRFGISQNMPASERKKVLEEKNFAYLYEKVFEVINEENSGNRLDDISDYRGYFRSLRFNHVDSAFKIIEQESAAVFVPVAVPVKIESERVIEDENVFSISEMELLQSFNVFPNQRNEIEGIEVWGLYRDLIFETVENRREKGEFNIQRIVALKTLQGIMSRFTFSLFGQARVLTELKSLGLIEEQLGFYVISQQALASGKPVYSIMGGLDEKAVNTVENHFL